MGKPALADRLHSDIDCSCRPLHDTSHQLRRNFHRGDCIGESHHHQTAEIRNRPGNLRERATYGVEREKLDVSCGYLHRTDRAGSDSVDMETLRAALRYAIQ